jgi:CBS domain-containing protein
MATLARAVMTPHPACCTAETSIQEVARLMVEHDCGEIPVVDPANRPVGVITDRDIVCRIVAAGKNPSGHIVADAMTRPAVTVRSDTPLDEVMSTMEEHQIRRVPVVDEAGCCAGIIAQADVAEAAGERQVGELVREVSRDALL